MRQSMLYGAAGLMALTLSACGGKQSAVPAPAQQASGAASQSGEYANTEDRSGSGDQKSGEKAIWAANRTHTAEENAQYQFTKNGHDFAATNESDYVAKAHAFVENPPQGVETLDRSNGYRLLYDAKQNIFAVVSRDGSPRTMFKPHGGATYWRQQKDRESQRSSGTSEQSQG